jgi:hypothetical protein
MNTTTRPDLPPSYIAARERADAAAQAERDAWQALGMKSDTSHDEAAAWREAHDKSIAAQTAFAEEVRDWFTTNGLD